MNKIGIILAIMIMSIVGLFGNTQNPEGIRIARENEEANNGFVGEYQEIEMILVNAQGDRTVRRMTSMIKETKKDGDKSIITFLWPADVKGTRMLTHSHKTKDDDQWLYLPSLKRVKRISSRNKSGSFMGSEFAYEDLGSHEVEKYLHKWLKDDTLAGRSCWVMQRIPVSKRSGYSKIIVWVDKEYRQAIKMEYYDRKGELFKVATFKGYVKLDKWWRVQEIHMENIQTRKSSAIKWNVRKLSNGYDDEEFESETLADM